jgi:hypothetical protein
MTLRDPGTPYTASIMIAWGKTMTEHHTQDINMGNKERNFTD